MLALKNRRVRRAPDATRAGIEPLESRIALSGGIGTGLNEKSVKFLDAAGDKVTVTLTEGKGGIHGAAFDITLDGGLSNGANIDTITLVNADAKTTLTITGQDGLLEVDQITADVGVTAVGVISTRAASVQAIDLPGVAINALNIAQGNGGENYLGQVNAAGIGKITMRGLDSTLAGPVTTTGNIGSIVGINLSIAGTVQAASVGTVIVSTIDGGIISASTSTPLKLTVNGFYGSVQAAGEVDLALSGPLDGSIYAAGNIAGAGGGSSPIQIFEGRQESDGSLESSGGNVANIQFFGTGGFGGEIVADTGNIGTLKADHFNYATVDAVQGSLGAITAASVTASEGIDYSHFHAGTTMGQITATDSRPRSQAIAGSSFRADGSFTGGITGTTLSFNSDGIVSSVFSTPGDITGAIIAKSFVSNNALSGDTFSAGGSLTGGIQATGNVINSNFLAGYDVGPDGVLSGTSGGGDDTLGSSSSTVTPKIGPVIISGQLTNSGFAAGISITDSSVGGGTDLLNNANGAITSLAISGTATGNIFEAGSLFAGTTAMLKGEFSNNTLHAYAPNGNIGDIHLVAAVYSADAFANDTIQTDGGNASIGNILVHNTASSGGSAISNLNVNSTFGSIGDVVGITDGTGEGITGSFISASVNVGTVTGIATSSNGSNGIDTTNVYANEAIGTALSAAGSSFITANSTASPSAGILGMTNNSSAVGIDLTTSSFNAVTVGQITSIP